MGPGYREIKVGVWSLGWNFFYVGLDILYEHATKDISPLLDALFLSGKQNGRNLTISHNEKSILALKIAFCGFQTNFLA